MYRRILSVLVQSVWQAFLLRLAMGSIAHWRAGRAAVNTLGGVKRDNCGA